MTLTPPPPDTLNYAAFGLFLNVSRLMGYQPEEKVRVKVEFMRMLARMRLDPARMTLLTGFFETYLKLDEKEQKQLQIELEKLDQKEMSAVMQLTTSWHEKGRAEGYTDGKSEGKSEG
jgi:flagellar biosynthesis/type III secretory pathway protein FliH